jgi:hypothetical protein
MSRILNACLVTGLALAAATTARAEPYVDYTPEQGVWEINAIEVDPNHVDDYLAGLRKSQAPAFEILKKRGIIDDYRFVVREGYVKGSPNVLIKVHHPNRSVLTPDKARDQAIEKEIEAGFSKAQGEAAVAGYEKYRTFVDDAYWYEVTIAK